MLILAFDTTAPQVAVAVCLDGETLAELALPLEQGHAEALVPLIRQAMADAGVEFAELDRIGVTVGPGSFTGVRVGLATARALGLAAKKPVVGVISTVAIAAQTAEQFAADDQAARILAVIDTKRGDVYAQLFDNEAQPLNQPAALSPEMLAAWIGAGPVIVAGDGTPLAAPALGDQIAATWPEIVPSAVVIARLAAAQDVAHSQPLPLYIRPPDATLPKDGGSLRSATPAL